MKKLFKPFITLLLLGLSQLVQADILVLIHGYLGDANSWERTGINSTLDANGWKRAGLYMGSAQGPQLFTKDYGEAKNIVFVANLPSEAPVMAQADILTLILNDVRQRHPDEPIILVGHSAGGVIARAAIVRQRQPNVRALITIASPHLGTYRANQALTITNNHGPFNFVKRFVGGDDYVALQHSRALMRDLQPIRPGDFLDWLNAQPHPDIAYVSVIRTQPNGLAGDSLVPGYSQDMNNVVRLRGRSATYGTPTSHYLTHDDSFTLLDILKTLD